MNGASAAVSTASEEDIMRTRLTIDGDGLGDDRRLTLLLKNVIKFCTPSATATDAGANEDEAAKSRDRIVALLAQAQWMDAKSKLAQEMNRVEQGNYEQLYRYSTGTVHSIKARNEVLQ